jgi:phage protein D
MMEGNGEFSEFAKKYGNFLAPNFAVIIGGKNLIDQGVEVAKLSVQLSTTASDRFSITANNAYDVKDNTFFFARDEYREMIQSGQAAEVKLGYGSTLETVFLGTVENVASSFPAGGQPQVTVSGYDKSRKMMKNSRLTRAKDKADDKLVRFFAEKTYEFPKVVIDATDLKRPDCVQVDVSDFVFLQELAKENSREFFVSGERFVFRKRPENAKPLVTLVWGESLIDFNSETNLASQVKEITVSGWDEKTKKDVEATVKISDVGVPKELASIIEKTGATKRFTANVAKVAEAEQKARSKFEEVTSALLTGSGSCIGLPDIVVGETLKLEGLTEEFNGLYEITGVTHNVGTGGYTTQFDLQRSG